MIKKINIFLVLLLLLFSISAVSASVDPNDDIASNNETISDIVTSTSDEVLNSGVADDKLLTASSHVVTSSNYNIYFNSKGQLIPSAVTAGDTLEIDGSFSGKEFKFDKAVNVIGTSTNDMKNCVFTFYNGASGSTISNLKIANTQDGKYGIFLNNASNCIIHGCIINNTGMSSYDICVANQANYNNVSNNVLTSYGITYGHGTRSTPSLLLSDAHHNYIGDNVITCDDANAIYLSSYSGGPLTGGESNFNTIHNNVITYNVLPTSWGYGIQVMGSNNTISSNRITGAYRGVSTMNPGNVIVDNWIINLTGADFNNPGVPSGGEIAIVGSSDSTIKNNHIVNAKVISTGAGITALGNSIVENNYVDVSLQGKGIQPKGSNIIIKNNTIITDSGSGILYKIKAFNLEVLDNNISSKTGIGVLIQKEKDKKLPGNITIVGNTITTDNKYAIDAAEADASSVNIIGHNNIKRGCMVKTPEGSYDPSIPIYNFNGTVHNINPSNYGDYINDNGGLSSDIKDGDILNFTGEFYDKVIFINSAIKITGDNPTFYNTTFRVGCNGVWIENMVIRNNKASRLNAWGILVYDVVGATVTNCDIEVYDPNAAYAIYVVESTDVDVINNRLFSSGDYLTYTLLVYAADYCKFENNNISTSGTGVVHQFENQNCLDGDTNCLDGDTNCLDGSSIGNGNHMLSEVYRTYGLIMAYSSNNNISGNRINVTSKLNETISASDSINSVVGIDLHFNSHYNIFLNNEIYIKANDNYIHGMSVLGHNTINGTPNGQCASNNEFINNNITLEGTYCVEGMVIRDATVDTIIKDNNIDLKSDNVAYGVTLERSQRSIISNNNLTLLSDVIYGIEAFSSNNNTLNDNELNLNGKQVYGILFSNSNQNSLISNKIKANGTCEKIDFQNFNSTSADNAGVYLKSNSTNNEIKKNNISSTKGYAVLVDEGAIDNIIVENYLDSEKGVGNDAVSKKENNTVENNYRYTFTGRLPMVKADYLDTAELSLIIDDGALVKFYIEDVEVGFAISSNGVATLDYKLEGSSVPGTYRIKAVATKENYLTKEFSSSLKVNKANLNVELNVVYNDGKNLVATFKDNNGKAVGGIGVIVQLNGVNSTATSDNDGKVVISLAGLTPDTYTAKVIFSGNEIYNAATASTNVTIKIETNLIAKNLVTVYNESSKFYVTLKDGAGNPIVGVKVNLVLGSINKTVKTDSKGRISASTKSLAPGNYTAVMSYAGNEIYEASSATANVAVNKIPTVLSSKDVITVYESNSKVYVYLKDINGNPITGVKINLILGNINKTVKSDVRCRISASTKSLAPGNYTALISTAGDAIYDASSTTSNVLVKAKTVLSAKDLVTVYNSTSKFYAYLKDMDGTPIVGVKVNLVLGSINKTVKTDNKGRISVSTKNLAIGNYTAVISTAGNEFYDASSATAKVSVNKIPTVLTAPDIIICYNDSYRYYISLKDVAGNPIVGVKVNLVLGDIIKSAKTDSKGRISASTKNLAVGNYTAVISTAGNEFYDASSNTANVVINKIPTTFTAKNLVTVYNESSRFYVALKDVAGNPIVGVKVNLVLGSINKTVKTDSNGRISASTKPLAIGSYTAMISCIGTEEYAPSSMAANVVVK